MYGDAGFTQGLGEDTIFVNHNMSDVFKQYFLERNIIKMYTSNHWLYKYSLYNQWSQSMFMA